jgi:hypothetical protein
MNPNDIADVSGRFKNTTLPRNPFRDFAGLVVKGKQYEGEEPEGVRCERCGKQESQYSHSRQSAGSRHSRLYAGVAQLPQQHSDDGRLAVYRSDRIPTNAASAHCAVKRSGMDEKRGAYSQFRTGVLMSDSYRLAWERSCATGVLAI